jgi:translation initiation factor 2 gamma subunit (eIF-2gamma)
MANIENLIICFNKLDLVTKEVAVTRKKELDELLEKLDIRPYIIIPTCFINILVTINIYYKVIN